MGGWCDVPSEGAQRHRPEPFAVRYSDARLESSADTRRVVLAGVRKALTVEPIDDEATRLYSGRVADWYVEVRGHG